MYLKSRKSKVFLSHIFFAPIIWAESSEFGTYRLCKQRRFRRACASAQSRQNLRCSLIQAVSQEEPSNRKPDPWPRSMAGHAQLKFVMTECSKTQFSFIIISMNFLICFPMNRDFSVKINNENNSENAIFILTVCKNFFFFFFFFFFEFSAKSLAQKV